MCQPTYVSLCKVTHKPTKVKSSKNLFFWIKPQLNLFLIICKNVRFSQKQGGINLLAGLHYYKPRAKNNYKIINSWGKSYDKTLIPNSFCYYSKKWFATNFKMHLTWTHMSRFHMDPPNIKNFGIKETKTKDNMRPW